MGVGSGNGRGVKEGKGTEGGGGGLREGEGAEGGGEGGGG